MYRDKLDELSARRRRRNERAIEAPLDLLSWPPLATAIWDALACVVDGLRGAIAIPRSIMTFKGPVAFFSVEAGGTPRTLQFAALVRAYRLIHDRDEPRPPSISENALAAVLVAMHGIRAAPILLPALDDRSATAVMLMHGRPVKSLIELHPRVRPHGQQPASVAIGETMEAPGSNIDQVVGRVARRLDRDLGELPFKYAGAGGAHRSA